jgi:hypothetical protein
MEGHLTVRLPGGDSIGTVRNKILARSVKTPATARTAPGLADWLGVDMTHRTARASSLTGTLPQEIPADVLTILALPALDELTDDQTRGTTCVWHGGERLTAETAVDLGEHLSPLHGSSSPMRWFPRACQSCTADRAHRGLFTHCATCKDCADGTDRCGTGRSLYRLVREYRR